MSEKQKMDMEKNILFNEYAIHSAFNSGAFIELGKFENYFLGKQGKICGISHVS
jgi:hypothetical protein